MGLDITGLGSVADFAKTIVNKIFPDKLSDGEKAQASIAIEQLVTQRETTLIEAQKSVIAAELAQDDNYTKRARPTIVYCGLAFIFLVHVFFPMTAYFTGKPMPTLTLPEEFWWAWGGVCSVWVWGRSMEKQGASNSLITAITGHKK